jgi:hypothetical protein
MASREVEIFKTSYKRLQDIWKKKIEKPLKNIEDVNKELAALDAKGQLTDDDKKRQKELVAQRERCQKTVEAANFELKKDLSFLDPPTSVTKDEMHELLKWMKKTLEKIKEGLPLGGGFTLEPEAEVDWKKLRFESLGVNLKWKF